MTELALIDHHVHGILTGELDRPALEIALTESGLAPPPGTTSFDSMLGFGVRRWCAPVLDLEPRASADEYVQRRLELGGAEVARRLLTAAGVAVWLVDTGFKSDAVTTPDVLAQLSGTPAREVARLESIAEHVVSSGAGASGYHDAMTSAVREAAVDAVGFKTVAAYRGGLQLDPARPSAAEVEAAAGKWLREIDTGAPARLVDRVLIRHGIWAAIDTGLPLQFHAGFGDTDSRLAEADPALLHDFLLASQPSKTPVMLLHCYPYHRQAGAMANLFPHVYMDVGVALNYVGARSATVLAEALEITPFPKMLYSSDAFGLPELHYLGAVGFRRDIAAVTGAFVADGAWSAADADRVADMIGSGNARRVYPLGAG